MDEDTFDQLLERADEGDSVAVLGAVAADPSLVTRGGFSNWTLLMRACIEGRITLAEALLKLGARVDAEHANGWQALTFAAGRGHLDVMRLLLSKGSDPNHRRDALSVTALGRAAFRDHVDCCALLIAHGADLHLEWGDGANALENIGGAYENGHPGRPPLSEEEKNQRRALLTAAFRAGPHPTQVKRRADENWARRKCFVTISVGHGYQPLAYRAAKLAAAALPPSARIPPLPARTRAQRNALLLGKVLGNKPIWQIIVSFI